MVPVWLGGGDFGLAPPPESIEAHPATDQMGTDCDAALNKLETNVSPITCNQAERFPMPPASFDLDGADGGGRTHTSSRIPDFESGASANSATSATNKINASASLAAFNFSLAPCHYTPSILNVQDVQDRQPGSRKREDHLSKDGKWRSFSKVPHLLQYVISGSCFGKVKINGRSIREHGE